MNYIIGIIASIITFLSGLLYFKNKKIENLEEDNENLKTENKSKDVEIEIKEFIDNLKLDSEKETEKENEKIVENQKSNKEFAITL